MSCWRFGRERGSEFVWLQLPGFSGLHSNHEGFLPHLSGSACTSSVSVSVYALILCMCEIVRQGKIGGLLL